MMPVAWDKVAGGGTMWPLVKAVGKALAGGYAANVSDRVSSSGVPNPGELMGRPKGCPTFFLTSTAPFVEVTTVEVVLSATAWCRLVEWERAALVVAHAQPEQKKSVMGALLKRLRADEALSGRALAEHPVCWAADREKITVGELIVRQGAEQAANLPKGLESRVCWMGPAL